MKYAVVVSYDGSNFLGWQKQNDLRSVQGEIENALGRIAKEPLQIHGSGRTDAKVHAHAQVFHFESNLNMNSDAWYRALNALCPEDIVIRAVYRVKDDFHAQYHAQSKEYEYRLNMGPYNPFRRNYEAQYNKQLNIEAIRETLSVFVGQHDFTSFNATELLVVENQVREVHSFDIKLEEDILIFKISGSGFLRYMVRMLVAACIEVGRGKKTPQEIQEILEMRDKDAFTRNAESSGLYLCKVNYEEGWCLDESL